jgi:hypothetical protein
LCSVAAEGAVGAGVAVGFSVGVAAGAPEAAGVEVAPGTSEPAAVGLGVGDASGLALTSGSGETTGSGASPPIPACAGVTYPAINRRPAIVKINEINPRRGMCVLLSALVGYQLNRSRWI